MRETAEPACGQGAAARTPAIEKITFVGIGHMGSPMAARLIAKGFDVTVYDVRAEAVQSFVRTHGGKAAADLPTAARDAQAVITMLPDDKVVRSVVLDGGLAGSLSRGAVVVDMGTSDPRATVALGQTLARWQVECVDAPVMGGVVFARDGSLDIMAGGDDAAVERCRPLFDALGRRVFRCGSLGTAHALKALANYVNACTLVNVIEAIAAGRKFGLDLQVMTEALVSMCCGRQHPLEKKVIPHVFTRKFATGMAVGLIAKDVGIAVDFARYIGAAMPLGERVREIWDRGASELGRDADQTEIARLWEAENHVKLEQT
jgi:3-hydroxyisobutyrate dehydrogenase